MIYETTPKDVVEVVAFLVVMLLGAAFMFWMIAGK